MKTTGNTLYFIAAATALTALSACQQQDAPTQVPSDSATGSAAAMLEAEPEAKPGIFAGEGRLVLPAVAGRPAAVYFTVRNESDAKITISAVHVTGAGKAEMHKTEGGSMGAVKSVDVAPGASVAFAPGGYHVMAFDLADSMKAGQTGELTLTFSDGDKISLPLNLEAMGGSMSGHDMPGMQH